MPRSSPAPALIRQAATMRAQGQSWDAVAKDVGVGVRAVQQWPRLHPRRWAKALRAAQQELTDEAVAESMRTLRRQLRSEDDKIGRDAAQKLLAYSVTLRKQHRAKPASTTTKPPGTFSIIATYLEGLTDAERETFLVELEAETTSEAPAKARPASRKSTTKTQ